MADRRKAAGAVKVLPPRQVQLQVPAAFQGLFLPYRHKGFFGGRGSAKSHSFAGSIVSIAHGQPKRVVCGRQYQNAIRDSVKELIDNKINDLGLRENGAYRSTDTEIRHLQTGSRLTFIGMERNPNSAKSLEGCDIFWGEEAQTFSQESVDIIVPTVRKPGSELWWGWNPVSPEDPVDNMLRGGMPPPRSLVQMVSFQDNPWFWETELPGEMEAMRLRDLAKYRHVWLGEYRNLSEAQIFTRVRRAYLDVPDNAMPRFGLDLGFSRDPNALMKVYLLDEGRTVYIARELVAAGIPMTDLPDWLDTVPETRDFPITADSSRPETIDLLRRAGFAARGAKKGPGSVKEGVAWLQGKDIVISPDCPVAAREFGLYSWKVDQHTGKIMPVIDTTNDHTIDGTRYAVEEDRTAGGVRFGSMSFGRRN